MKAIKSLLFFVLVLIQLFTRLDVHAQEFLLGVDLSYTNEMEDCGTVYSVDAMPVDPFDLFSQKGADIVRLRLWHDPQWTSYSNLNDVIKSMERAKMADMRVLLDFHYSDVWTDPSRQWRPRAWDQISDNEVLADSLYNYTYQTLEVLSRRQLLPAYIQIGNEINGNMLLSFSGDNISDASPSAELYPVNWERQVQLLNAGLQALKDFNEEYRTTIQSILHVAQPENAAPWFRQIMQNGIAGFDIIGLSYYPQWSNLNIRQATREVAFLKEEFQKEVLIVEFSYPWTTANNDQAANVFHTDIQVNKTFGQPDPAVQKELLIALTSLVRQAGGLGVIYWEPGWVSTPCRTLWGQGSHGENATFFDFEGELLEVVDFLHYDYSSIPIDLEEQEITFQLDLTNVALQGDPFIFFNRDGFISRERMAKQSEHQYAYTASIPGRSIISYRFELMADDGAIQIENIPTSCQAGSNTREAVILNRELLIQHAWNSCDEQVVVLDVTDKANGIQVYPNPVNDVLVLEGIRQYDELKLVSLTGRMELLVAKHEGTKMVIDVRHLTPGLYDLILIANQRKQHFKILIR